MKFLAKINKWLLEANHKIMDYYLDSNDKENINNKKK